MQIDRLRYTLANSVKEGLVRRARNWKGVHSVDALIHGELLTGYWFDRSKEYAARNRGERYHRLQYATAESVVLAPIPCWRHLPEAEWRRNVAELVEEVEARARAERRSQRRPSKKGRRESDDDHDDRVQLRHPHYRPSKLDHSSKPRFHAKSKRARRVLEEGYAWFLEEFHAAAQRLRDGAEVITAGFPEGSFPPRLPFVAEPRGQPP